MTKKMERAWTVRPQIDVNLQPLYNREEASEGVETEEAEECEQVVPEGSDSEEHNEKWQKVNEKVEELADRVAQHFDDTNEQQGRKPPI